ncbi:MAG: toll/interleukin-1 receptor domain-containing protein [Anaerolineae bacterium]|nr:toll/interleukin-1 receptor domain-containing protein [Anaerolineae bacterium]
MTAPKVFISYKRDEEGFFIKELRRKIEGMRSMHVEVFQDVDMPPGIHWMQEIDQQIQQSFAVVVVLTRGSVSSPFVTYEWSYALGAGIGVLPLLRHKGIEESVHGRLKALQHLDCSSDEVTDSTWKKLRHRLHDLYIAWLNRNKPLQVAECLRQLFKNTYRRRIGAQEIIDQLALHRFLSPNDQLELLNMTLQNKESTRS